MSQQQASRTLIKKKALILKGGGVKGIALAGAYKVLADYYEFDRFAGASAGAIGAALLAAGCTPEDLAAELRAKNFADFCDSRSWFKKLRNLLLYEGMHSGKHFSKWVADAVHRLSRPQLGAEPKIIDLPKKVAIFTSEDGGVPLLFDQEKHPEMLVSRALRLSMSIPYFFTKEAGPNGLTCVDGGVLNNFPVEVVLSKYVLAEDDFIGIYLGKPRARYRSRSLHMELLSMWLGQGEIALLGHHKDRIVVVEVEPIRTTEFDLSSIAKEYLYASGQASAMEFILTRQLPGHPTWEEVKRAQEKVRALRAQLDRERKASIGPLSLGRLRTWLAIAAVGLLLPVFGELCGAKSCTKPFDVARDAALQPIGGPYACQKDPPGCHQPYAIPLRVYGPIEAVQYQGVPPKFDGSPPKWVVRCPDDGGVCGPQGTFLSTPNGEPCEGNTTCYAWFAERHGVSATHRFAVTYGGGYYFYNTGLYALWRTFRSWAKTALQT